MKIFRFLLLCVVGWCVLVFFYGIVNFLDAPYKKCEGGPYCGKTHKHHTEAEYEAFSNWQFTLFMSWPFGMIAGHIRNKLKPAKKAGPPAVG